MDGIRWTVGVGAVGLIVGVVVGVLTRDVILAIIASAGLVAVVMQGPRLYRVLRVGSGGSRQVGRGLRRRQQP